MGRCCRAGRHIGAQRSDSRRMCMRWNIETYGFHGNDWPLVIIYTSADENGRQQKHAKANENVCAMCQQVLDEMKDERHGQNICRLNEQRINTIFDLLMSICSLFCFVFWYALPRLAVVWTMSCSRNSIYVFFYELDCLHLARISVLLRNYLKPRPHSFVNKNDFFLLNRMDGSAAPTNVPLRAKDAFSSNKMNKTMRHTYAASLEFFIVKIA